MEKFNNLGKGNPRNNRKISDMVVNHLYKIEGARKTKTAFGEKVVLDLENNEFCFLPARFTEKMLDDEESGLKEFQDSLRDVSQSIRRLPGKLGRSWPIDFVPNDDADHAAGNNDAYNNAADNNENADPKVQN